MKKTDPRTPRDSYHHGDLKAQLIEATRILVEEKGPNHFSVSEACRKAGVSTAAPYKHFKDKTEMLRDVAMGGMQRQRVHMVQTLAPHPVGSQARIVAMGQSYVGFAQAEPGVFRLMFGLSKDHGEDAGLVAMGDETYHMVQLEVAQCFGRTEITAEDKSLAFMLWSFVHGLSFLLIDGKLADAKVDVNLDDVLRDIARRVIAPRA